PSSASPTPPPSTPTRRPGTVRPTCCPGRARWWWSAGRSRAPATGWPPHRGCSPRWERRSASRAWAGGSRSRSRASWDTTRSTCRRAPRAEGGCLAGRLEDGRAVRTGYDAARCNTRVHTHWVGGFQKVLEETLNEPDREKRKMLVYGDFMTRTLWAITYSSTNIAQCFE